MIVCGYGVDLSSLFCVNDERYILREPQDFIPLEKLIEISVPTAVKADFLEALRNVKQDVCIKTCGRHLLQVAEQVVVQIMGGEAEETGLATLLSVAAFQNQKVRLLAVKDIDGNEYIMFQQRYPWNMNGVERVALRADIERIVTMSLRCLTHEAIHFQELRINPLIVPGTG